MKDKKNLKASDFIKLFICIASLVILILCLYDKPEKKSGNNPVESLDVSTKTHSRIVTKESVDSLPEESEWASGEKNEKLKEVLNRNPEDVEEIEIEKADDGLNKDTE